MEELTDYKSEVDKLAGAYVAEKEKHEKQLENMRGKYTPEFLQEARENWEPKMNYRGIIDLAREVHGKIAMEYFGKIESELDTYFQAPVDSGFASTVSAIKALGVTLNSKEAELLEDVSGGYWGRKLLFELMASRTKAEQVTELENGELRRKEKETKIPYGGAGVPDIERFYSSLQDVKNAVNIAFEGYCGQGYELRTCIQPIK